MKRINRIAVCFCLAGSIGLLTRPLSAQDEGGDDPLVTMVLDLVKGDDPDMRTLGLQQIREEVPGEAVTQKFAALLPDLSPAAQVGLLDALGERGDAAARPAVLEMLDSDNDQVRAAALKALGPIGSQSEVALLAKKAAGGSDLEKRSARQGLVRLRGEGINATIIAELEQAEPNVRAKLLEVLATRSATEAVPTAIEAAGDDEVAVRVAALGALRLLADENNTADLVKLLKAAPDDATRRKAELALLTICARNGDTCFAAVREGMGDADPAARLVLLRAVARIGGDQALEQVVAATKDEDEAVRDEAVRMLSAWRDAAAAAHLMAIAKAEDNLRHQVLAIRGLARLAARQADSPADLTMLAEVLSLAKRPEERRLLVGVVGNAGTMEALDLVTAAMNEPALAEGAAAAAVTIAENVDDGDKAKIRSAMETVNKKAKNAMTISRAQKVLGSL